MIEFLESVPANMFQEMQHLESIRIFHDNEIKSIMNMRKSFDFNLKRQTKSRDDYIRYIKYEMELLNCIRTRKLKMFGVDEELDMNVAARINRLFKQAIFNFYGDMTLWLTYIKFCEHMNIFSVCVSYMLVGMLSVHNHKPCLWKLAASWEFEINSCVENSRQFLLRGLKHHPDSKLLFMEAFRMELMYVELKKKELENPDMDHSDYHLPITLGMCPEWTSTLPWEIILNASTQELPFVQDLNDQWQDFDYQALTDWMIRNKEDKRAEVVVAGRIPEIVYNCASKKISDLSFFASMLNVAKKYPFTEKLQARIIRDVATKFPKDEQIWGAMARRELDGLTAEYFGTSELVPELCEAMGVDPCRYQLDEEEQEYLMKQRIKTCCMIYQHGLQHLRPEYLWKSYLDSLIEINSDVKLLRKYKRKLLRAALQKAHDEGHLEEKYYLHWASTLTNKKEKLSKVLELATDRHPTCLELWETRLNCYIARNEELKLLSVFNEAINHLSRAGQCTLALWKLLIEFYQTKSPRKVEQIFAEGINQGTRESEVLKPMFLEWLVLFKADIRAARQAYQAMCDEPPYCRQLHLKMAALESLQSNVDLPRVVKCYDLAIEQFGRNNTDVWMEYIKFEKKRGNPTRVKEVYQRALVTLDERLAHDFIAEFCECWVVKENEE